MPRLPKLTPPVLADLAGQLRFAPGDVVRRAIDRAESLAGEIDRSADYPAEWIVYRVTKYRPDSAAGGVTALVPGRALLAGLSAFVEHLCDAAAMREAEVSPASSRGGSAFVSPDELAARWCVSRKTIDRCRREGLVARRVLTPRGKTKLFINLAVAEAFRAEHREKLAKAASFSRMDQITQARMLRRAARYRRRFGWSLNQVAARLAKRFHRSHETVRQLLRRHDRAQGRQLRAAAPPPSTAAAPAPDFGGEHSMTRRDRRVAYRAWRRAIEPSDIAARLGHRKPAVLRGILLERLARLREALLWLGHHAGPTFASAGADRTILAPPPVRSGLGEPGHTVLADFLSLGKTRIVPVGAEETARSVAYHFLLWRASRAIVSVSHLQPSAAAIDAIETDLRWAARLKAELIRSQIQLMLQTLEGRLETSLGLLRPAETVELITSALALVAEAVHAYDPFRASSTGARLAGSISPPLTRLSAQWARRLAPIAHKSRATAVYSGRVAIADWTLTCCPWQAIVEPRAIIRAHLSVLPPDAAEFLAERFGWSGGPPLTLAELASAHSLTPMRAATNERRFLRRVLTSSWQTSIKGVQEPPPAPC